MIIYHNPKNILSEIVRGDLDEIVKSNINWDRFKNKTILVSGGAGLLPSYLVQSLLHANRHHNLKLKVICMSRSSESVNKRLGYFLNDPYFKAIIHDVTRPIPVEIMPSDFVIHAASQASPKFYAIDPVGTLLTNTIGTQHLLEYSVRSKAERFMFFSSGEVYGAPLNPMEPITETSYGYLDPMNVRSCYAESKRIGETLSIAWAKQYGLDIVVVRPFHTYGPGMALDDGRVFADFVADVVAKKDISIRGDGSEKRCFCYLADATVGFLSVLLNGVNLEAYNVANPLCEISMKNLAKLISDLFPEHNIKIRFENSGTKKNYLKSPILKSLPSIEKIKKLGWFPTTSLEEGFSKTIKSFIL
jgi:nucleoside-diphosphate-sugar epimerase